ncbi:CHAT domain-containing protein [Paractinoplanes lichenicola]|uniref:CHAT domain-containing protein n=1 Tax=Paractinoplanes lichenicola TaxID=2802976 RepID=A0ABS1VJS2_9ACTN|nr:CHAT domain-containing protein [Actinoplanes lichenicola]MBL7254007.1 CHAT domain-containing protein [Actinoplanes lichenicola]
MTVVEQLQVIDELTALYHALPEDDPDRLAVSLQLSLAHLVRYRQDQHLPALDASIAYGGNVLHRLSPGHPSWLGLMQHLAGTLLTRHEKTADPADLDEAIGAARAALAVAPNAALFVILCTALLTRRRPGDLDVAVRCGRAALDAGKAVSGSSGWTVDLAHALEERFHQRGGDRDLGQAVELLDRVDDSGRDGRYWHVRGSVLLSRAQVAVDHADVGHAITAFRAADRLACNDPMKRADSLGGLGGALVLRFERCGQEVDLDEAVEAQRQAVRLAESRPEAVAHHRSGCALALMRRHEHTGNREDLSEAVELARAAAAFPQPDDAVATAVASTTLQIILQSRYDLLADTSDLRESIAVGRRLLKLLPPGSPQRVTCLFNLAMSLRESYDRDGEPEEIAESISLLTTCLAECGEDFPERAVVLGDLSRSYCLRYRRSGAPADLDRAVEFSGAAVALSRDGRLVEGHLSVMLESLRRGHRDVGLDELVSVAERALAEAAPGPRGSVALFNAAVGCWQRFLHRGDTRDAALAQRRYRDVAIAAPESGPVGLRVRAARGWQTASMARADLAEAVAASAAIVALLPLLAWHGIGGADRRRLLTTMFGAASDSAGCAIEAGRPAVAVEHLEEGRTILWSQVLDIRGDLSQLHKSHPGLADRLDEVRSALDAAGRSALAPSGRSHQTAEDVDGRMALAREWDDLVARVRARPGFAGFLRPPRLEALLPAAADGPVVILNVSQWRCDALIVRTSGVEVVELPLLTADIVTERVQAYLEIVRGWQGRDLASAAEADAKDDALGDSLRWMWDSFAAPVLDHLGYVAPPVPGSDWPRIWWCPTGLLALLPIHAAGYHSTPGKAVLDRVVSSYTPTLRALLAAREGRAGGGRLLFVGMPDTPGQADLPNVNREEESIVRLFADRCTRLVGPAAEREAVMKALLEHDSVHFACHGEQSLGDPSLGRLFLQDGDLTVTDFASRRFHGEFAYLSGCKTAVGGFTLPDEAISLAAALYYMGYRHVIATLWSVRDDHAAQVAEDVYLALVRDGVLQPGGAARALHDAVRRLREALRNRPGVWTPFTHTGP